LSAIFANCMERENDVEEDGVEIGLSISQVYGI
jgi:hypothetical protein